MVLPFQTIEQVDEPRAEQPEDKPLIGDLFGLDRQPGPPAQGLDQQADLGRQQADHLQPQEWLAAGRDRAAGWPQADLH